MEDYRDYVFIVLKMLYYDEEENEIICGPGQLDSRLEFCHFFPRGRRRRL